MKQTFRNATWEVLDRMSQNMKNRVKDATYPDNNLEEKIRPWGELNKKRPEFEEHVDNLMEISDNDGSRPT